MDIRSLGTYLKKSITWISFWIAAVLVLAACQGTTGTSSYGSSSGAASTSAPAVAQATTAPAATSVPAATTAPAGTQSAPIPSTGGEATLNVASKGNFGNILVDSKGMTLYMFLKDGPDKVTCSGNCAKNWPPLTSQGSPKAGTGVDSSLIGTTALSDGTQVVTFNKHPLYYYFKDQDSEDVYGQGVGDVWYVVSPSGEQISAPAGTEASSTEAATESSATSAPAASATTAPLAAGQEATINVATDANMGKILVDSKGMTLYMFTVDGPDKSNCNGQCLKFWPPLLTQGNPTLGSGVDSSLVGSTTLADGSKIVTYNHMPLYYFANDKKPGDVNGQYVRGTWFVVSPDGKPFYHATLNMVTDPKLGKILVDGRGMTLYVFTKDTPETVTCTGDCAGVWPPFFSQDAPTLGSGIDASLIGSTTLANGMKVVTYNHMPLYYYAKDTKPGDVTGQGVGSVWFTIGPDGKMINGPATSSSGGGGYYGGGGG